MYTESRLALCAQRLFVSAVICVNLRPIKFSNSVRLRRTAFAEVTAFLTFYEIIKILAPLHFLFSLMISGGLSRPGGEVLRAGQTMGANISAPLHFASAEREHKKHISLLQRWK